MMAQNALLIFGCGGHARSVADVALASGFAKLLFVDPNARPGEICLGFPVQAAMPDGLTAEWAYFSAAGDNLRRQQQIDQLRQSGLPLATLIAPTATIGVGATIAEGTIVAHHAHVGPLARIGSGVVLNTGSVVEHDCVIGDFTHVSVNATVAGKTSIGKHVFLGAGSTVIDGIEIADNITIGAGGVAIASFREAGTYVGVPCRLV